MANNTFKNLNIEITAKVQETISSLDVLYNSMSQIASVDMSSMKNCANSLKTMSQIDTAVFRELGNSLEYAFNSLNNININTDNVQGISNLLLSIKGFGSKAVEKAIPNMELLGVALEQLFNRLSKLPVISNNVIATTNALANFAQSGSKIRTASNSIIKSFEKLDKTVKKSHKSIKKQASGLSGIFESLFSKGSVRNFFGNTILSGGFNFIKQSISGSLEYASALVETQNVIDHTFKSATSAIDKFTANSIEKYGMNSLEARKMIGQYQSMGTAMGESAERMSTVSVSLAKLAGDYASFYNLSVSDTAEKFQSIFTGMARPLRAFGLDLTETTLEQYALDKGIKKSIKSMTQLEKTQLRYNYVVEHSKDIFGDFERTQDSYANQTKVLQQQLQDLAGSLGTIAINIITPFIKGLNQILAKLREVASYVANLFQEKFGFNQVSGGVQEYEDLTDSVDDYGNAVEEANNKKFSSPIDELNVLDPNKGQDNSIAQANSDLMDWNDEWAKAEDEISKGFETSFIDDFIERLKPIVERFQNEIATPMMNGFNDAINQFDFSQVGRLFGTIGNIGAEALRGTLDVGAYFATNFEKTLPRISSVFSDLVTIINDILSGLNISNIIDVAVEMAKIGLATVFYKVNTIITVIKGFLGGIKQYVQPFVDSINNIFTNIKSEMDSLGLIEKIERIGELVSPIAYTVGEILGILVGGIFTVLSKIIELGTTIGAGFYKWLDEIGAIDVAMKGLEVFFNSIKTGFEFIRDIIKLIVDSVIGFVDSLIDKVKMIGDVITNVGNFFGGIGEAVGGFFGGIGDFFTGGERDAENAGERIADSMGAGIEEGTEELKNTVNSSLVGGVTDAIENESTGFGIHSPSTKAMSWGQNIDQGFADGINANKQVAINATSNFRDTILNTFTNYGQIPGVNSITFSDYARLINEGFAQGINQWGYIAKEAVRQWAAEIMAEFESEMDIESPSKVFYGYGEYVVEGFNNAIKNNISESIDEVKNWGSKIESAFNHSISNGVVIPVDYDVSGFVGDMANANQNSMENAIRLNQNINQEAQPINISLKVDSREIARANYKGRKQLGYQVREY